MSSPDRWGPVPALVLVGGLLLAACTGEARDSAAPEPERPEPEPPPVCQLTGEDPRKNVDLNRPAIALKIENSPEARPQSGLDQADVVFEEIVEGGITRFMAIYHCRDAAEAGPVRSGRFDDPRIAKPFTNILAFSGVNAPVAQEIKKQKFISIDEDDGGGGLARVPPGSSDVHSLYGNTVKLRRQAEKRGKTKIPSSGFFEFGEPPSGGRKAGAVTIHFNPSIEIGWRWRGGEWRRFEDGAPFEDAGGDQISTPNLLIQEVEVNNSKTIVDVTGNPSPDIDFSSGGRAFLFRDGRVVAGKWKMSKKGVPRFETKKGEPFTFEVGTTWIELVPSGKGEVKGSVQIPKK